VRTGVGGVGLWHGQGWGLGWGDVVTVGRWQGWQGWHGSGRAGIEVNPADLRSVRSSAFGLDRSTTIYRAPRRA